MSEVTRILSAIEHGDPHAAGQLLTRQRMKEAEEEEPPKPSTRLSDSGAALASISAQRHRVGVSRMNAALLIETSMLDEGWCEGDEPYWNVTTMLARATMIREVAWQ
jgi:hypothetical protein